jgi:hypothetical protein
MNPRRMRQSDVLLGVPLHCSISQSLIDWLVACDMARSYLEILTQAANVVTLATNIEVFASASIIRETFPDLNIAQIRKLLQLYTPDKYVIDRSMFDLLESNHHHHHHHHSRRWRSTELHPKDYHAKYCRPSVKPATKLVIGAICHCNCRALTRSTSNNKLLADKSLSLSRSLSVPHIDIHIHVVELPAAIAIHQASAGVFIVIGVSCECSKPKCHHYHHTPHV